MFFYTHTKKKDECFICCTEHGKTDNEILHEYQFNRKTFNYPLLQLSNVYNCNCKNNYAHNRCLYNIKKCPTCRKIVIKPNLYKKTKYDDYLQHYFNWIKEDAKRIKMIDFYILIYTFLIFIPILLY